MLKRYASAVITLGLTLAVAVISTGNGRAQSHPMLTPADLKWGPAPPVLPPGAQVAILDGDPFTPGFYALRLKMPDGYKIAPHWHPTDENVVVLQGTLGLGMGTTLNPAAAKKLTPGSFTRLPSEMRHYAIANGETILQIYGQGPFEIKYVNPKDDPSKKQ